MPVFMRTIAISFVSLFILTQCHEASVDRPSADLFVGTWKNVANEHTIAFDKDYNYAVKFRSDTAFHFKYRLHALEEDHRLFIYDGKVTQEYAYQFLEENQLQLTQVFPAGYPDMEKPVVVFQRLK
jgi:hypothetical protein